MFFMKEKLFHVLNRGVDKRLIFADDQDRFRFVHDLFEFNDEELVNTTFHKFQKHKTNHNVIGSREVVLEKRRPRKFLVNIHAFTLMPNHYHLLLSPVVENGMSRFMHKLNLGYSRYFNERHERKGTLFEGRYKQILISSESHFIHLPYYIHLNCLDLVYPEWRRRELKDFKKALMFLNKYRWSSHLDYLGIKNFPSVTQREFLMEFFGNAEKYQQSIEGWLSDFDLSNMTTLTLE